jgi:hypothetical protein
MDIIIREVGLLALSLQEFYYTLFFLHYFLFRSSGKGRSVKYEPVFALVAIMGAPII